MGEGRGEGEFRMKKNIFITGASAGIGKATAITFAKQGWLVGAVDVDKTGLERLQELIGEDHYFDEMDVTDTDKVEHVLSDFCKNTDGKLTSLFNNAGLLAVDPFEKVSIEKHQAILDVNIKGVMNCTYKAFPFLKRSEGASVINMSSVSANYGIPSLATYSGSKFFIRGLTEALNVEWEQYNIHVCDIMPNFVNTPMVDNVAGKIVDNVGVHLTAQDVADTVWKAAHKKRLHWPVDRLGYRLLQKVVPMTPNKLNRFILKNLSGYSKECNSKHSESV